MNENANSHEPLVDTALIGLDLTAEHHLANCPCCQVEREKTEQALRHFADLQWEAASRPESFWEQQLARIHAARRASERRSAVRAALVPAIAVIVLLAFALAPQKRPAPKPAAQAQAVSDHDLLVEVQRAVDNGTPYALEPVALVDDDSNANSPIQANKNSKELRSHAN